MKVGRSEEARAEFERAAALTRNARERALLLISLCVVLPLQYLLGLRELCG